VSGLGGEKGMRWRIGGGESSVHVGSACSLTPDQLEADELSSSLSSMRIIGGGEDGIEEE